MATITIAAVSPRKTGAAVDAGRRLSGGREDIDDVRQHMGAACGETVEAVVATGSRLGVFPGAARTIRGTTAAAPDDRFAVLNGKLDRVLAELAAIRKHFAA